jgi:hypothetical protein
VVVPPPGAVEGDSVPVVGCANAGVVAKYTGKVIAVAKTTIANIVDLVTFTFILIRVFAADILYK